MFILKNSKEKLKRDLKLSNRFITSSIINILDLNRQLLNILVFNYVVQLNLISIPSNDHNDLYLVRVKPSSSAISESVRAYVLEMLKLPPRL